MQTSVSAGAGDHRRCALARSQAATRHGRQRCPATSECVALPAPPDESPLYGAKSKRTKRSRANKGYFNRGNSAAYGFRYVPCAWDDDGNVIDTKLVPDERTYIERGFSTVFAPTPYAARKEMIRLYAEEGLSCKRIADLLNAAPVPSPFTLLRRDGASGDWQHRTVSHIVHDPLNQGILVNRFTDEDNPPQQIIVNSIHGNPEPLVDERMAQIIEERRKRNREGNYPRIGTYSRRALLSAGLARCGALRPEGSICGASMRVHGVNDKGKRYLYYTCTRHENQPTACPGMRLNVKKVDPWAWWEVLGALSQLTQPSLEGGNNDNYVDVLARLDTERTGKSPSATADLDNLRKILATFEADAKPMPLKSGARNRNLPAMPSNGSLTSWNRRLKKPTR
jgi:Recombinase/Recombinase zinc beta ribbon domain